MDDQFKDINYLYAKDFCLCCYPLTRFREWERKRERAEETCLLSFSASLCFFLVFLVRIIRFTSIAEERMDSGLPIVTGSCNLYRQEVKTPFPYTTHVILIYVLFALQLQCIALQVERKLFPVSGKVLNNGCRSSPVVRIRIRILLLSCVPPHSTHFWEKKNLGRDLFSFFLYSFDQNFVGISRGVSKWHLFCICPDSISTT